MIKTVKQGVEIYKKKLLELHKLLSEEAEATVRAMKDPECPDRPRSLSNKNTFAAMALYKSILGMEIALGLTEREVKKIKKETGARDYRDTKDELWGTNRKKKRITKKEIQIVRGASSKGPAMF